MDILLTLLSHPFLTVNCVDAAGQTPLLLACSQGAENYSQVILELYILSTGRDKVTRILVKHTSVNVNVNKKCFQGFTPLLAASMAGFRFCVKVIKSQYFSFCLKYTFLSTGLAIQQILKPAGQMAGHDSRDPGTEKWTQEN